MDYFGDTLDVEFDKATNFVRTNKFNTTQEHNLQFYSYFKQATLGPCKDPEPGFFDFTGKAKWNAWAKLQDMDQNDAKQNYLNTLNSLVPGWKGGNTTSTAVVKESWKAVSSPTFEDIEILEDDKTICDFVVEDKVAAILTLLSQNKELANFRDQEGTSALHFAADKGSVPLCKLLIENGALVSVKDSEGQTPLHYACTCEHQEVVDFLIAQGANPHEKDNSGESPLDLAEEACNNAMKRLNL